MKIDAVFVTLLRSTEIATDLVPKPGVGLNRVMNHARASSARHTAAVLVGRRHMNHTKARVKTWKMQMRLPETSVKVTRKSVDLDIKWRDAVRRVVSRKNLDIATRDSIGHASGSISKITLKARLGGRRSWPHIKLSEKTPDFRFGAWK